MGASTGSYTAKKCNEKGHLQRCPFLMKGKNVMDKMTNIIPWVISGCMLLFTILTYVRKGNKDKTLNIKEEDSKFDDINISLLKANVKLDQVCATTNETRSDVKALNKDIVNLDRRVSIIENEIDSLKKKG